MKDKLLINKDSNEKFYSLTECFGLKNEFYFIAGPCAVESEQMLESIAKWLSEHGVKFLRAGLFKPRTSPYSYQGMHEKGLDILKSVAKKYNMYTVSEVTDPRDVDKLSKFVNVLQIGARNMQNFDLLREVGRIDHPVVLKRHFSATVEEFKFAAEYIAMEGNRKITLCERGIRTFETSTKNTLDISSVPILQNETKLSVIVDLCHSIGRRDIVIPISRAIRAVGADGIMAEVHPNPSKALSDQESQLTFEDFSYVLRE